MPDRQVAGATVLHYPLSDLTAEPDPQVCGNNNQIRMRQKLVVEFWQPNVYESLFVRLLSQRYRLACSQRPSPGATF